MSRAVWLSGPSLPDLPGVERLSAEDVVALQQAASTLKTSVDALAAIMSMESRFDPSAVNSSSGATGLIQFLPSTAKQLGTTVEQLRTMTFQQQLTYVVRFYKSNGCVGEQDVGELYLCTFCPAIRGEPDGLIVAFEGVEAGGPCGNQARVYSGNSGLDRDGDGALTVSDIRSFAREFLARAKGDTFIPPETPKKKRVFTSFAAGGVLAAGALVAFGVVRIPS